MKEITISILQHEIMELVKEPFKVLVEDDADIVKTLAAVDQFFTTLYKGNFPIQNVSSILQLVWNPRIWNFYEDMGLEIRDQDGNWIPLRGDPTFILPSGTDIKLTPDAGC